MECHKVFIKTTKNEKLDWNKYISIYSDGAKAITGENSYLIIKLKKFKSHMKWTRCFLHRHAHAVKPMSENLKNVLSEVVKIVNYIKSTTAVYIVFDAM